MPHTPTHTAGEVLAGRAGLLVAAGDAALVLDCHPDTLLALARTDRAPVEPVRIGRSVRWRVHDLRTFVGLPALVEVPG